MFLPRTPNPVVRELWVRHRDADGCNSGIHEREDQIARRDFAHALIKGIVVPVRVALRRPEISALDLMAERLILISPPVAHRNGMLVPHLLRCNGAVF
jgi:hypothetical protein